MIPWPIGGVNIFGRTGKISDESPCRPLKSPVNGKREAPAGIHILAGNPDKKGRKKIKVTEIVDKVADMGKSTEQKQYEITAAEVGNAWNKLMGRYDLLESLMILVNYIKDDDLRKEVQRIIKQLNRQVRELENIMSEHTVVLPPKPAEKYAIKEPMAQFKDRYIFLRVY